MSRTATMATGFFLILAGIQLHMVESFTLTPRMSHFLNDTFSQQDHSLAPNIATSGDFSSPRQNYNSPYYQASYSQPGGNQRLASRPVATIRSSGQDTITPPRWFCWPVLFLGAFLLLQGAIKPRH
jgi:hypothetical protein